ncbi:hypothetical protein LZ554_000480 [Drepanopeziza brunnea f. sp. 'monogermtubi']|nr:hypothetical protein LZ554_000480 [Drepanopeziza brunnea f. sp. 'monogermtubi']
MSDLKNLFRMAFPTKKKPAQDVEHAPAHHGNLEPPSNLSSIPIHDDFGRPDLDPSDSLNMFRHLTGILSHTSMAHSDGTLASGRRPAPNLGIYARVVHNENTAKVGYKYFSVLINGCLGLQIVVAASLTALGAAGGSRGAVTVFGAINTVFAGILTFLKGSGLPNRLKFYQLEWKRVREFIEQRERDFSRPDCDLNVRDVAAMVEAMYEEVKMELEASTPDRFAGVGQTRKIDLSPSYKFPSALIEKSKEIESAMGSKVKNLASEITHFAQQAREVGKDLQAHKDSAVEGVATGVEEYRGRAERMEHMFGDKVKDLATEIGQRAHMAEQVVHDAEARERVAVDGAVKEAREQLERLEESARRKLERPLTINVSHTGRGSN